MTRAFVIVAEAVASVTDLANRLREIDELERRDCGVAIASGSFAKNRMKGILREDMFDVGDEQLLMLLFVMQSDDENRFNFVEQRFVGALEKFNNVGVD